MRNPFRKKGGGQNIRYIAVPTYSGDISAASPQDIEKRLNSAIQRTQATPQKAHDPKKFMDESRKTIALTFVFSFVIIVAAVVLLVPIYNAIVFHDVRVVVEEATYRPLDVEKVLATVGTLLGAPLGFVVGYYFKEEHNRLHAKASKETKQVT